jgi:hypothetical protein
VKNPFLQPKPGVLTVDDMAIERVVANGAVIGAWGIALKVLSGKLAHDAGFDCRRQSRLPIHSVVLRIRNRVVARGPFKRKFVQSAASHAGAAARAASDLHEFFRQCCPRAACAGQH